MLCQPVEAVDRPSTAPWGHQLRRKNSMIASTTAMSDALSTPKKMTPRVATSESTSALVRTLQVAPQDAEVHQRERGDDDHGGERGLGRSASSPLRNSRSTATRPAPTRPVTWLLAPDCSATAVREPLVDTAKPWKKPGGEVGGADADHLLVGLDLVAAPRREGRRRGDGVGQGDERDADRRDQERPDVADARSTGSAGVGTPWGSAPTVFDALVGEAEHGRDDRGADHGHEHRRHAAREAGQHEQHGEAGQADDQRRRVGLVEALDERLALVDEAVGVGREAEELGQLADDDGDGRGRSCSRPAPPSRAGRRRTRACRARARSR